MTNAEIYSYYQSVKRGERAKTITKHFCTLDVNERKSFIQYIKIFLQMSIITLRK